jgi:hypothetical protein
MKTIIAGSRHITSPAVLEEAIARARWPITEVVSGGARGVDRLGEQWASANNLPCKIFPAQWSTYGKSAGPIRNAEMARYADALIALWDGESRGTKNMIDLAKKHRLLISVRIVQ